MIPLKLAHNLMMVCEYFQFNSAQPVDAHGTVIQISSSDLTSPRKLSVTTLLSDTEVFVTDNGLEELVVTFRGSETPMVNPGGWQDWVGTDFHSNRMAYPPAHGFWPDQRWVHRGFWEAYDAIAVQLIGLVQHEIVLLGIKKIYVTGHSLGGAMAYLAALHISSSFPQLPVHLYSFGAPRVGDASLNYLLRNSVATSYFVIIHGDPVPHLPPIGPNLPVTFKQVFRVRIGPYTVGFGSVLPQFFQNYETGKEVVYINENLTIQDHLPVGEIAMAFEHHMPYFYSNVLGDIPEKVESTEPYIDRKKDNMAPVLHSAMRP